MLFQRRSEHPRISTSRCINKLISSKKITFMDRIGFPEEPTKTKTHAYYKCPFEIFSGTGIEEISTLIRCDSQQYAGLCHLVCCGSSKKRGVQQYS